MLTLKNMCKMVVVKYGLAKEEIPQSLIEEIEHMEGRIQSELTGVLTSFYDSDIKVEWSTGEWSFTPCNQPSIKIRAGRRNCLGSRGGELFLLPGRNVVIEDFKINLEERRVTVEFLGSCSSVAKPDTYNRMLKSTVGKHRESNSVWMCIELS
eukprot:GFUD01001305.1.p1 GENE.GFUD01001305.1~~GFUD01001305.1.p1  ORF type:complete len:153 (-),score=37.73 GFUD01001305.1:136-594(-)